MLCFTLCLLKENNAVALIDICKEEVLDIFGLGIKDHSLPENKLDASDKDSGKFHFQFCSDLMLRTTRKLEQRNRPQECTITCKYI